MKEMYDMLNSEVHNKHSNFLETIVLLLVLIEVLVEVVWDIFKLI
jgi:uncharacterized Rmd1/YagE family protein